MKKILLALLLIPIVGIAQPVHTGFVVYNHSFNMLNTLFHSPVDFRSYSPNAGILNSGYNAFKANGVPIYATTRLHFPGSLYRHFPTNFGTPNTNGSGSALPVTLISFIATVVNNQYISVSWATASEINNAGYMVERSTDGLNFDSIGWINGHDNSTTIQEYSFNDYEVTSGIVYYYRLIQYDNNGNETPTDIVSARLTGSSEFIVSDFYPNPAVSASKITVTISVAQSLDIELYDLLGRQLSVKCYNLTVGENVLEFDVQRFSSGTYTAIINSGNQVYAKKLVVAKSL